MAGKRTGQWQKFPRFIEYANDRVIFQGNTESIRTRACRLAIYAFADPKSLTTGIRTGLGPSQPSVLKDIWHCETVDWSSDSVWEALVTNQNELRIFLDAMVNGDVQVAHLQWLKKHASHLWMDPGWANIAPGKSRRKRLSGLPNPDLQYYERMRIQDPLDGIYWQLREFLRLGGEQRLRKCPHCKRYFVQPTARLLIYCDTKCRLNSNPSRRDKLAAYQRTSRKKSREKLIQEQLKKVQEAKAQLRAEGETELALGWVCDEAGISRKRFGYLRRWEEEKYGGPRITDLTRP